MSEEKLEILSWRYNDKEDQVELLVDAGSEQKMVVLTPTIMVDMAEFIPSLQEEKMINKLLESIKKVIERRHFVIEELDKALDHLRDEHKLARQAYKGTMKDKLEVFRWNGIVKSLAAEKVVLAEKRHLIKLLLADESDLRARLAKIRAGRN